MDNKQNKRETGIRKEELAAEFPDPPGRENSERNFRCRQGEIDLIGRDGRYLVFLR